MKNHPLTNHQAEWNQTIHRAATQATHELGEWVMDGEQLRHQRTVSLILAELSDEDYEAFDSSHVPRSGSTGKGRKLAPLEPYIATTMDLFINAVAVMGWTRVDLCVDEGGSFIARRAS